MIWFKFRSGNVPHPQRNKMDCYFSIFEYRVTTFVVIIHFAGLLFGGQLIEKISSKVDAQTPPQNTPFHHKTGSWVRGGEQTLQQACSQEYPGSARCVQSFDDSLDSAIRITYRISLRSSSMWEPRHPSLKVVLDFHHVRGAGLISFKEW